MSVVSRDPQVCGGTPVFAGTRVPVSIFFDCLAEGYTVDLFVDYYPTGAKTQAVALLDEIRDQFKSRFFDETAYLNSTAANRAALARSLQEAADGKTVKI